MISVIIPNYNGYSHLETFFNSLKQQTLSEFKVIFVDNCSSDSSVNFVKEIYPDCEILIMAKNLGFSKAVNYGINYAIENYKPEYIVLLNNDIECDKNFLAELKNGFTDSSIGSVASKMLNYFDRNKIDDAGNFIRVKEFPYARGQNEIDAGQYDKEELIFCPCAGAAMYRTESLIKTGLFDEDYISYFEDVDLGFRMQYLGFKCNYNPKAVCYHKRGATSLANIAYHRYLIERNIIILRTKNYPFKIILKYFFVYYFNSYHRIARDAFWYSPKTSLYSFIGNITGMLNLFKSLYKRYVIMKNKTETTEYILNVWTNDKK